MLHGQLVKVGVGGGAFCDAPEHSSQGGGVEEVDDAWVAFKTKYLLRSIQEIPQDLLFYLLTSALPRLSPFGLLTYLCRHPILTPLQVLTYFI